MSVRLDEIGWDILEVLQREGRIGYAELGRRVGLSAPAVAARVRSMEEAGVITGYRAEVDLEKIGLTVQTFVRMNVRGGPAEHRAFLRAAHRIPEVVVLWRLSGAETYLLRVAAKGVSDLERVLRPLWTFGDTITSVVMSMPIPMRPIGRETVLPAD